MQKIKILIVDDEQDIVYMLRLNLNKNNYDTIVANTLLDAEKLMNSEFPKIVLLDKD